MNSAWATSLEQIWRSPSFPMWLTLGVAVFFGLIVLITLLRADKSVANGALTVITLLALAVASAASIRGFTPGGQGAQVANAAPGTATPPASMNASLPALSCLDELAGETVLAACEKVLFGSAESVAAAVSHAAARLDRLISYGDVAAANKVMTAELASLRRSVERDRFGLIGYVLSSRDYCQLGACAAYASLTTHDEIAAHMEQHTYDTLIARYAPGWNAPQPAAGAAALAASGLPPSMPTGKPTNADFPTAASIPPVNIMTPEPPLHATRPPPAAANAQAAAPAAPKKQAAPRAPRPASAAPVQTAPVQLAPPSAAADN